MGEYIKFKGEAIKIGTCESLYYATYPKYAAALNANLLSKLDGNSSPEQYAKPDSGFRFRFPFPDEDHLSLGDIGKYKFDRGVSVKIDNPEFDSSIGKSGITTSTIDIVQQKLVHRKSDNKLCLAIVCRNPIAREYFRLEDDADIKKLLGQIIKFQIEQENNLTQKAFYRTIALRILKGYRLNPPAQTLERKIRHRPPSPPPEASSKKLSP